MKTVWMAWVMAALVVGCGGEEKKKLSAECRTAADAAFKRWGKYVKVLEKEQPKIATKAAKYTPEKGYDAEGIAAKKAIEAWEEATAAALETANKARFGKPEAGGRLALANAAVEAAKVARDKADAAIEAAFAARLAKGAAAIARDKEALEPKDGKKLSAKQRKKAEEKLKATMERVSKNNQTVETVKKNLTAKADHIYETAKWAADADALAVVECTKSGSKPKPESKSESE